MTLRETTTYYCTHLSCKIETVRELRELAARVPGRYSQLSSLADQVASGSTSLMRCRAPWGRPGIGGTGCDAPLAARRGK